jgi:hypothetical protein
MSISESRVEKTSSGRDLEMSPPFLEISKYDLGKADIGATADPSFHTHTVRLIFFRWRRHYTSQLVLILLDGLHSIAGVQQGLKASSSAPMGTNWKTSTATFHSSCSWRRPVLEAS